MHKRLVALPGRQAAEHRRGGGRGETLRTTKEGERGDVQWRRRRQQSR